MTDMEVTEIKEIEVTKIEREDKDERSY